MCFAFCGFSNLFGFHEIFTTSPHLKRIEECDVHRWSSQNDSPGCNSNLILCTRCTIYRSLKVVKASKLTSYAYLIIIQNGRRFLQTCAARKRKRNVLHVKINSGGDAEEHAGIGGVEG